jgi:GTP-binding protein
MVDAYLTHRPNLLGLILIIDIRRDPGQEEQDLARWLTSREMPYLVVLTKADKLSKTQQQKRAAAISSQMNRSAGEVILFSAKTRAGRETVLEEIASLVSWHEQSGEETN